jgi:hypothetical protein
MKNTLAFPFNESQAYFVMFNAERFGPLPHPCPPHLRTEWEHERKSVAG